MPDDPHHVDQAFTDLTRDIASRVHAPTPLELIRRAGVQRGRRAAIAAGVSVAGVVLGVTTLAGRVPVSEPPIGLGDGSSTSSPATPERTTTPSTTTTPTITTTTTRVPASAFLTPADVVAALDPWSSAAWRESAHVPDPFDWGGCTYDDRWATRGVLRRDDGRAVVESQISVWPSDVHAAAAGADIAAPVAGCESNTSDALIVIEQGEARMYGYKLPESPEHPAGRYEYTVVAWTGRATAVVTLRTLDPAVLPDRNATQLAAAVLTRLRDLPTSVVPPAIPASTGRVPESAFLTAADLQFLRDDLQAVEEVPSAVDWVGCVPSDLRWQRELLAAGDDFAVLSQVAVFDDQATTDTVSDLLYRGLDTCVVDGRQVQPADGISGLLGTSLESGALETMLADFDLDAAEPSGRHRIQQAVVVKVGLAVAVVTVQSVAESPPDVDGRHLKQLASAVLERLFSAT